MTHHDTFTQGPINLATAALSILLLQPAAAHAAGGGCLSIRGGTSDFDQARATAEGIPGLPGDGGSYCHPTTWASWMAYLNQNGFPNAMGSIGPVPDWSDPAMYNYVTARIDLMGQYCGTTGQGALSGQGVWGYIDAMGLGDDFTMTSTKVDFEDDVFVTPFVSPDAITAHLQQNHLVSIGIAWSTWEDDVHWGDGSHVVGVVGTLGDCSDRIVLLNNPSSGDSKLMQSPFVAQDTRMFLRIGRYERSGFGPFARAMWELDDYSPHRAHLSGIRALIPNQAYLIPDTLEEIVLWRPSPIGGGGPQQTVTSVSDLGSGFGVAPHPTGLGALISSGLPGTGTYAMSWLLGDEVTTVVSGLMLPHFTVDRFGDVYALREQLRLVCARLEYDEFGAARPVIVHDVAAPTEFIAMA